MRKASDVFCVKGQKNDGELIKPPSFGRLVMDLSNSFHPLSNADSLVFPNNHNSADIDKSQHRY